MPKQTEPKELPKNQTKSRSKHTSKQSSPKRTSRQKKNASRHISLKVTICFLMLLSLLSIYCFDITPVSTNAMMPALNEGDVVLSWSPRWINGNYEPGDVVLLANASSETAPNFLRLIAEDGTVSFHEDEIQIDGNKLKRLQLTNTAIIRPQDEPEIWRETLANGAAYKIMLPQHAMTGSLKGEVILEKDVFLAGDNRYASYDSRQNGAVDRKQMKGKALIVLESTKDDGFLGKFIKWIE